MKSVLKHLNKNEVNLSSEKVELSSIDKLKEIVKDARGEAKRREDAIKWAKKAEEAFKIISDADGIIEAAMKAAGKFQDSSNKMLIDFAKKAEELGIKPSSVKEWKEAEDAVNEVFREQDLLAGWADTIKKLRL